MERMGKMEFEMMESSSGIYLRITGEAENVLEMNWCATGHRRGFCQ